MKVGVNVALISISLSLLQVVSAFSATPLKVRPWTSASRLTAAATLEASAETTTDTGKQVLPCVAVAGATGRTGEFVVKELLDRGAERVVALVRSEEKAAEVLPNPPPDNLEIVVCDLNNNDELVEALKGVKITIWCATGFSSNQESSGPMEKVKTLLGLVTKRTIDSVGLPLIAENMKINNEGTKGEEAEYPKLIMCSSAGVTRPSWSEEKKARFPGAADIPIVRLNPFGILDVKRESEEGLRATGVPYCIVRPAGLNDNWPVGSRPIVSQGDVAVGRINRQDVASILVDLVTEPEATGKTFEVIALAGYPRPASWSAALARLQKDGDGFLPMDSIAATYTALQQLLPGEQQDSAALAMGQTYEEYDDGTTGRLGRRGEEDAEAAAPKPSS